MERSGQWRFTPPTHVVAAFASALEQHEAEGGVAGRLARYARNKEVLVEGMRAMGFHTLLADRWLSPIIVTFHAPGHLHFDFNLFYRLIKQRGFIIYPGKLTEVDSFRIGCIGQLFEEQMRGVLTAIRAVLDEKMCIRDRLGGGRCHDAIFLDGCHRQKLNLLYFLYLCTKIRQKSFATRSLPVDSVSGNFTVLGILPKNPTGCRLTF